MQHRPILGALGLGVVGDLLVPAGLGLLRGVEHVFKEQAGRRNGRSGAEEALKGGGVGKGKGREGKKGEEDTKNGREALKDRAGGKNETKTGSDE